MDVWKYPPHTVVVVTHQQIRVLAVIFEIIFDISFSALGHHQFLCVDPCSEVWRKLQRLHFNRGNSGVEVGEEWERVQRKTPPSPTVNEYKKAQLSLTNPRDAKACQKLLKFDVLTTLSLTILVYIHTFSCCCVQNLRNPEKFSENSNFRVQGHRSWYQSKAHVYFPSHY